MINDFVIKSYKKKIEQLGVEDFEQFSCDNKYSDSTAHFFKFKFDTHYFYFSYYSLEGEEFDFGRIFANQIYRILDIYTNPEPPTALFKSFIKNQTMSLVSFEGKSNFTFPVYILESFYKECFSKYFTCKDFMDGIRDADLRKILKAKP